MRQYRVLALSGGGELTYSNLAMKLRITNRGNLSPTTYQGGSLRARLSTSNEFPSSTYIIEFFYRMYSVYNKIFKRVLFVDFCA
jgi:hypothetical protein